MVSVIGNFWPGLAGESENMELRVGDSLTPTENPQFGDTFNYAGEVPVNAYGEHVFVRRGDGETLALTSVMVFSDCDCRGVTWGDSRITGFPMELEVGETASGQILSHIHSMSSTETPDCSSSDCLPTFDILLADGSPRPTFMTYDGPRETLKVAPTQTSDAGIYSLPVRQQVWQGSTSHPP